MGWGDGCEGEVKIVDSVGEGNLHYQENIHKETGGESQRISETPGWGNHLLRGSCLYLE